MIAFLIRTIGLWLVAGAIVAVVVDGMKSIAIGSIVLTPLGQTWASVAPRGLAAARDAVSAYTHPLVWDGPVQGLLLLPTWIVLLVLGSLLIALASRRRRNAAYVI